MIKRIRISNFLSFASLDEELGLRTVLVGPNMSGKSNFISCLTFLAIAVNPAAAGGAPAGALGAPQPNAPPFPVLQSSLRRAFGYLGGFSEVLWKGTADEPMEIGISAEISPTKDGPTKIYEYEIAIEGDLRQDRIFVSHERLTLRDDTGPTAILERTGHDVRYVRQPGDSAQSTVISEPDRLAIEALSIPGSESDAFRNFVSSWRFYRLNPLLMKAPNTSAPQPFLLDSGANLSSWLFTLQGHRAEFERIRQVALDELPSLADLLIQPAQLGMVYLTSTERRPLRRPVPLARMSDGEVTFLALVSIILAPEDLAAPLYCIEEPESHLHPRLLETLVEVLNQRQGELGPRAPQIIVTTHSPLLVDRLDIGDLVVVEKAVGATKFQRPSTKTRLRKLVANKETGLGDLWYSGALGGT